MPRVARVHSGASVLPGAALPERTSKSVLRRCAHSLDPLGEIVRRRRRRHLVVENAAVPAPGDLLRDQGTRIVSDACSCWNRENCPAMSSGAAASSDTSRFVMEDDAAVRRATVIRRRPEVPPRKSARFARRDAVPGGDERTGGSRRGSRRRGTHARMVPVVRPGRRPARRPSAGSRAPPRARLRGNGMIAEGVRRGVSGDAHACTMSACMRRTDRVRSCGSTHARRMRAW